MKSEELKSEIERAERARGGLEEQVQMLNARVSFLDGEMRALAWPVAQREKRAVARLAELETEIAGLRASLEKVNGAVAASGEELARLRAELAGAELEELEHARDVAALEESECLLKVLELRAQIDGLERQASHAHERAQVLNVQIGARGRQVPLGWPERSDENKRRVLGARADELQRILSG